jgi:hypothetical protein
MSSCPSTTFTCRRWIVFAFASAPIVKPSRRNLLMKKVSRERWVDIPGYAGAYQVSDLGRVRSLDRVCPREYKGDVCRKGVVMRPQPQNGYLRIGLTQGNHQKWFLVHVLVWTAFCGPLLKGEEVNHVDGLKSNCCLTNLEKTTRKGNMEHAARTGLLRPVRGIRHHSAKLSEAQVREIRARYVPRKVTCSMLAREYKVDTTLIAMIVNRQIWKHI